MSLLREVMVCMVCMVCVKVLLHLANLDKNAPPNGPVLGSGVCGGRGQRQGVVAQRGAVTGKKVGVTSRGGRGSSEILSVGDMRVEAALEAIAAATPALLRALGDVPAHPLPQTQPGPYCK